VALAGQRPDARVCHILAAAQAEGAHGGAQRRNVQQRVVACDKHRYDTSNRLPRVVTEARVKAQKLSLWTSEGDLSCHSCDRAL